MKFGVVVVYEGLIPFRYHLGKCHELGVLDAEVQEIFSVATLIGGTIVVPHLRRATEYWEALRGA